MKQLPSSTLNLSSVWARLRKIRRIRSHHHRKKRTSSVFLLQLLVHNLPRLPNQALQRFPNQALQVKRAHRREKKQNQLSLNRGLKIWVLEDLIQEKLGQGQDNLDCLEDGGHKLSMPPEMTWTAQDSSLIASARHLRHSLPE